MSPVRRVLTALLATSALVLVGACDTSTGPDTTPATLTIAAPSSGTSIPSGTSVTLSATVSNKGGAPLSGVAVTWSSSDPAVASVSGGVVTAARVGSATITASAGGVTNTLGLTVIAGAPAALTVRTQPSAARVAEAFASPPAVEVRDAAGNLATATVPVTVGVTGGGTLGGTTTVSTVGGIATFSGLAITGTIGSRTLTFSAPGLATATSASFVLSAGAPAALSLRTQPGGAAAGVPLTQQPVVEVRDAGGNVVSAATIVTASLASGAGVLGGSATATAVAGVATFTDLSIGGTVGARTLSFSAPGVPAITSQALTLSAGPAAVLAIRTPPGNSRVNIVLPQQPVIEVRDAFDNVATTATSSVTATVASGGGTLSGTTTVSAVGGVATFTSLAVASSTAGARTLTFTAPGLTPVTSTPFSVDAPIPASIVVERTAVTLSGLQAGAAVTQTLAVTNAGDLPLTGLAVAVQTVSGDPGWLSATLSSTVAPTTLTLRAAPGTLALGTYTANVTVSAPFASGGSRTISVSFTVIRSLTVSYRLNNARVALLDVNGSALPTITVRDALGADVANTQRTYISRNPAIVRVGTDGRLTGAAPGATWVLARLVEGGATDSIWTTVTRDATGPVVSLSLTDFTVPVSTATEWSVLLDTRGASVGAVTLAVGMPFAVWDRVSWTLVRASSGSLNTETGQLRFTATSANGFTGVVELARFTMTSVSARGATGPLSIQLSEILSPTGVSLAAITTAVTYQLQTR